MSKINTGCVQTAARSTLQTVVLHTAKRNCTTEASGGPDPDTPSFTASVARERLIEMRHGFDRSTRKITGFSEMSNAYSCGENRRSQNPHAATNVVFSAHFKPGLLDLPVNIFCPHYALHERYSQHIYRETSHGSKKCVSG